MIRRLQPRAAGLVAVFLVAGACGRGRTEGRSWPGAPVVLISIDTLRSDHLPMYGYTGVETPALSGFRRDAILFERAYSNVPLTLPSHATLFTGQLPAAHGIRDNLGYRFDPKAPTLAELLGKAGYATGGAVSSIVLAGSSGVSRGFGFWEDSIETTGESKALGRVQRSGGEAEELLARWLDEQPREKPFFAFLHLYEPHTPYEPPEPYAGRYKDRPYDGEIAWADALAGRFLDRLRQKGLYERALVVVLSDHGEGLGEHGEDEHGIFLYRWALQVPLMVKLPGGAGAGTSVATPVQLADVFRTVVQAVGVQGATDTPGTVSLLEVAAGRAGEGRTLYAETLFPRIHFGWADTASLVDGRWQYIDAPRPELYDLAGDPAELKDLAPGLPREFRTLRIEMEKRRSVATAPGSVDPEEARKLASLGYLSSGAKAGTGPLPDAKDEIGIVSEIRKGSGLLHTARYTEAVAVFEKLLGRNPRMLDVWDLHVQALQKLGRDEEALEAMRKAIAASPEGGTPFFAAAADACLRLGRVEEARKYVEVVRGRQGVAADDLVMRLHLACKEWDAAESQARAILAAKPSAVLPQLVLAQVAVERNQLPRALQILDGVGGAPPNLHFLRGDVLARMERSREAEPEFLEEIRLFPDNVEAYVSLAGLYASEGRFADARETIRKLVTANPTPGAFSRGAKALEVMGDGAGAQVVRRAGAARFPSDPRFRGRG